jgi:hypothetical protein
MDDKPEATVPVTAEAINNKLRAATISNYDKEKERLRMKGRDRRA